MTPQRTKRPPVPHPSRRAGGAPQKPRGPKPGPAREEGPQRIAKLLARAGIASRRDIERMIAEGRKVFERLEQLWGEQHVQLVDLKIEFGRDPQGTLMVADMIDNDSWRLWPDGDKAQMLDKQIYRNMQEVTPEGLELLKDKYADVRDRTERFRPEDD